MSYRFGNFEFDTEEEYNNALDDFARIKEIKDKCDIDDPDTVKKLLFLIKNKKIVFKTKVGAAFVKVLITKFEEQNGVKFSSPVNKKAPEIKEEAVEIIKSHLTEEELRQVEEAEAESEKCEWVRIIAGIVMFILALVCFPLFLGILVILIIFAQIDRLKYLWKNRRAFLLGILITVGYMVDYTFSYAAYNLRGSENIAQDIIGGPVCFSIAIGTPIILLLLMRALLKTQTYLSIRNIASYPIVLVTFLLPFAAVALLAYARYAPSSGGNGGNGGGNPYGGPGGAGGNPYGGIGPQFEYIGEPPTVDVRGHVRHYANGNTTWVRKHTRTMPDATVLNNFSYHN